MDHSEHAFVQEKLAQAMQVNEELSRKQMALEVQYNHTISALRCQIDYPRCSNTRFYFSLMSLKLRLVQ